MKKISKLFSIILMIAILFFITTPVNAATSSLSTNSNSVTVGDTIKITVKVNAAQWKLTLTANGKKVDSWVETVNYKENLSKTFTASYKTTGEGTVTFKLEGDITDVNQDNTLINTSKSVTVKAKSTSGGNTSGEGNNNTTTQPPTFTKVNETVYATGSVNVRKGYSTSDTVIGSLSKGDSVTRTGKGSNGWSKVTYKGQTAYIISSSLTTTKPAEEKPKEEPKDDEKSSNKNLSSLSIEGIEIIPAFNKETTQYTATVDGDVSELKINAKAEDSKAKVEIEGNEELKEGDNIIKIKVTAENETTRTYFITVTKGEGTVTDGSLKLSDLQIKGVDFGGQFNPDTHTYELNLNTYVKNLDITATASQADAKVEITGNEEFKEGKNIVTILLTSADGKETATYQIEVNLPAEVVAGANKEPDTFVYIIAGVIAAIAIIILIIAIVRFRSNRKEKEEEADEEDFISKQYGKIEEEKPETKIKRSKKLDEQEIDDENKPTSRRRKSDVSVDEFLNSSEEEKPKRPRGKHSV